MKSLLNRTTAPQLVRLLDYCFKRGVLDAAELEDDYKAKDWLEARKKDWKFGLVYEDETIDWRRWRFFLLRWCRLARLGKLGETYIDRIYSKNIYFVCLNMTFRFYMMGVEEWLEYPNRNNTQIFKQESKIHWKPVPQYLRKISTDDFISYLQEFAYEYQNIEEAAKEDNPSDAAMASFCRSVWQLTRKYPTYGEVRDGIEAEEDS